MKCHINENDSDDVNLLSLIMSAGVNFSLK